jgi:hypothetical protein
MTEDDFKLAFPIIRQTEEANAKRRAELYDRLYEGEDIPDSRCLTYACGAPRWKHPVKGELVVCIACADAIAHNVMNAPPIRRNIDYQGHPTPGVFLMDFSGTEKKSDE